MHAYVCNSLIFMHQRYLDVLFYIQAAHGGACLFSDRHRGLMAGVERLVIWSVG